MPELSPFVAEFDVHLARAFEPGETQRLLESLLVRLAQGCLGEGARVIGHIKLSALDDSGGSFFGSITSPRERPRVEFSARSSQRQLFIKLAVLVYGLTLEALARITKQVWEALVEGGQVKVVSKKEQRLDDQKASV